MERSRHDLLMCRQRKQEKENGMVLKTNPIVENFNLYVSFDKNVASYL